MKNRLTRTELILLIMVVALIVLCSAVHAQQKRYFPAQTSQYLLVIKDGGHAPGDIISYEVQLDAGSRGIDYFHIASTGDSTKKTFLRSQVADSVMFRVRAYSMLTEKQSGWAPEFTVVTMKSGQTEPPPVVVDTGAVVTPTDWVPAVYDAYNIYLIWGCGPWGIDKNWYRASVRRLLIPSSLVLSYGRPHAVITLNLPTTSEYCVRVVGYGNGVKVDVDGAELYTAVFNDNNPTTGNGRRVLSAGLHTFKVTGWNSAGAPADVDLVEIRIYRPNEDYSTPALPQTIVR